MKKFILLFQFEKLLLNFLIQFLYFYDPNTPLIEQSNCQNPYIVLQHKSKYIANTKYIKVATQSPSLWCSHRCLTPLAPRPDSDVWDSVICSSPAEHRLDRRRVGDLLPKYTFNVKISFFFFLIYLIIMLTPTQYIPHSVQD